MPPARLRSRQNPASALQRFINVPGDRTQRPSLTAVSRASPSSGRVRSAARLPSSDPALDGHSNRLLNVRRQFLRHVDRKPPVPSIARQGIAAVSYARCTSGTVLPNTGALPQRNGTHGNRPELLDSMQERAFDLFWRFVFGHSIGVIVHLDKPCFKIFVSPFSAQTNLNQCIDGAP